MNVKVYDKIAFFFKISHSIKK